MLANTLSHRSKLTNTACKNREESGHIVICSFTLLQTIEPIILAPFTVLKGTDCNCNSSSCFAWSPQTVHSALAQVVFWFCQHNIFTLRHRYGALQLPKPEVLFLSKIFIGNRMRSNPGLHWGYVLFCYNSEIANFISCWRLRRNCHKTIKS